MVFTYLWRWSVPPALWVLGQDTLQFPISPFRLKFNITEILTKESGKVDTPQGSTALTHLNYSVELQFE